jgi:DUF4097 and DUF4098 domain-containing protein YvlB
MTLSEVGGNVEIDDGTGSIWIIDAGGNVSVRDGTGEIEISRVAGNVTIDDGTGSIEVSDVEMDLIVLESGTGGLHYETIQGSVATEI